MALAIVALPDSHVIDGQARQPHANRTEKVQTLELAVPMNQQVLSSTPMSETTDPSSLALLPPVARLPHATHIVRQGYHTYPGDSCFTVPTVVLTNTRMEQTLFRRPSYPTSLRPLTSTRCLSCLLCLCPRTSQPLVKTSCQTGCPRFSHPTHSHLPSPASCAIADQTAPVRVASFTKDRRRCLRASHLAPIQILVMLVSSALC